MEAKDIVKALVTAVLTAIVASLFKYIDPPTVLTEIWQRVFVGPWFLWLGAAAFGMYWFVKFLISLHRTTESNQELAKKTDKLLTAEMQTRESREAVLKKDVTNSINALIKSLRDRIEEVNKLRSSGDTDIRAALNHLGSQIKELSNELSFVKAELQDVSKCIPKPIKGGAADLVRNPHDF